MAAEVLRKRGSGVGEDEVALSSALAAELQCAICMSIFKTPVARLGCCHIFCSEYLLVVESRHPISRSCIQAALPKDTKCPLCKRSFTRRDISGDELLGKAVALFARLESSSEFLTQAPASRGIKRLKTQHQDHHDANQHNSSFKVSPLRFEMDKASEKTSGNQRRANSPQEKPLASVPCAKAESLPLLELSLRPFESGSGEHDEGDVEEFEQGLRGQSRQEIVSATPSLPSLQHAGKAAKLGDSSFKRTLPPAMNTSNRENDGICHDNGLSGRDAGGCNTLESAQPISTKDFKDIQGSPQNDGPPVPTSPEEANEPAAEEHTTTSSSKDQAVSGRKQSARLKPWSCPACTLENAGGRSRCTVCGCSKSAISPPSLPVPGQRKSIRLPRGMNQGLETAKNARRISLKGNGGCESARAQNVEQLPRPSSVSHEHSNVQKDSQFHIQPQHTERTARHCRQIERLPEEKKAKFSGRGGSGILQKSLSQRKLCVIGSGLSKVDKAMMQRLQKLKGVRVVSKFEPSVTHVVCGNLKSDSSRKTIKYMLGVLGGKWVVQSSWLEACLQKETIVEEEAHESSAGSVGEQSGPILGRMSQGLKLLKHWEIYLHPAVKRRTELEALILASGAVRLCRPPLEQSVAAGGCDREQDDTDIKPTSLILVERQRKRPEDLRGWPGLVLATDWLTDTCSAFVVQCVQKYEL